MLLDLTRQISPELPVFPGSPSVRVLPWNTIRNDGYNAEMLYMSSHTGTHMDAPYHFDPDGLRMHQIPVDVLMGRALLLEMPRQDGQYVTGADIIGWQEQNGAIPPNSAVIIDTGWEGRIGEPSYFSRNPGLSADAAEYLASVPVSLVGTDSPSIDAGGDDSFPAHRILARAGALNVENLVNLDKIPGTSFRYAIFPLKIADATGSPVRALAILEP